MRFFASSVVFTGRESIANKTSPTWIWPVLCAKLDGELNCFTNTPVGEFDRTTPSVVLGIKRETINALGRESDGNFELMHRFDLFDIVISSTRSDLPYESMLGIQKMAVINHYR